MVVLIFIKKHVIKPADKEDLACYVSEYESAGLDGACGSADAVNIVCDKASCKLRQKNLGHKQSLTTRTCNVTCTRRRRITHVTSGFPARWNDKTIVKFDEHVNKVKGKKLYDDVKFRLCDRKTDGSIIEVWHTGAWVLCNNGYLKWSTLIPSFVLTSDRKEVIFSK